MTPNRGGLVIDFYASVVIAGTHFVSAIDISSRELIPMHERLVEARHAILLHINLFLRLNQKLFVATKL